MSVYSELSYRGKAISGSIGQFPYITKGEFDVGFYSGRCPQYCPAPAMVHHPKGWQCHKKMGHTGPHLTTDWPEDGPLLAYWYTNSSEL